VLFLLKCFLSLHQQINFLTTFKFITMKKSSYLLAFVIVALFFTSMAYIAHKIIEINGSLPIDFI
jgi:hypothetical protein